MASSLQRRLSFSIELAVDRKPWAVTSSFPKEQAAFAYLALIALWHLFKQTLMPTLVILEPSTVKKPDKLNKLALETNRSLTSVIDITVGHMLMSIDDTAWKAAPTLRTNHHPAAPSSSTLPPSARIWLRVIFPALAWLTRFISKAASTSARSSTRRWMASTCSEIITSGTIRHRSFCREGIT